MERQVYPGEFYRHFKNKLYQILAVATHSETGERMVVYQALYGDFGVYVRPYEMFLSPVDREKYPDVTQQYRFERVEMGTGTDIQRSSLDADEKRCREETLYEPSPGFLKFLDADTYEERMECLSSMARTAKQREVDSIYLVLDMKPETGTIPEQIQAIERFLTLQNRFDGKRLR